MKLDGRVDVYEWTDPASGMKLRIADYDPVLSAKLGALVQAAGMAPALKIHLDKFSRHVLSAMKLPCEVVEGEAPFYYWVRSMKTLNRLSFEDGVYNIPESLAACIVRSNDAKHFIRLLGG